MSVSCLYAFQSVFFATIYNLLSTIIIARETYFYLILFLSVILNVITMSINFILDVEPSYGAGHLYSTSWCTQFDL